MYTSLPQINVNHSNAPRSTGHKKVEVKYAKAKKPLKYGLFAGRSLRRWEGAAAARELVEGLTGGRRHGGGTGH